MRVSGRDAQERKNGQDVAYPQIDAGRKDYGKDGKGAGCGYTEFARRTAQIVNGRGEQQQERQRRFDRKHHREEIPPAPVALAAE
jgi:hypothetical protein